MRQFIAQLLLELGNAEVELRGYEFPVLVGADEGSVRIQRLRDAAMLHFVTQIIVGGFQAKPLCFEQIDLLQYDGIDGLGKDVGLELFGKALALHHVARHLIDFLNGDLLAIDLGYGIGADAAAAQVIENSTGNKRDNHHDADDGKEADEKHSLNAALGLQESNHLPLGSEKLGAK